jgi:short subunit dehydrogenase-like uncharacterized protein
MKKNRFDVIVFGATSFVGQLLCRYLLQEFGSPSHPGARKLRWAIAGRSSIKLGELVDALGPHAKSLDVLVADAADEDALHTMCAATEVVVSTVGPYALYGEPLIRVCTTSGTDYCDLTGEVPWMARMIRQYSDAAEKSGARIVHCCGFDSIPSDMGVWFLQQQALLHFGEPCIDVKMRVKAMRGGASGGTIASLLNVLREATRDAAVRKDLANPYALCHPNASRYNTRQTNLKGATFDTDFQKWATPFVMSAINVRVVLRSNALLNDAYGHAFRYQEAMLAGAGIPGRAKAWGGALGLAGFVAAASVPITRSLMEKFVLPKAGEGPSPEAQAAGFFDFRFIGRTADGHELHTKVTGDRDPGYGSTAKMLGEAAACLALDIPKDEPGGGFWTPSTALGEPLYKRLQAHAGIAFTLLE